MKLRVLHTSDLHGNYDQFILAAAGGDLRHFDVWVDTGDFLPTYGRRIDRSSVLGADGRIDPYKEVRHQTQKAKYGKLGERLTRMLAGRPLLSVPGNHDFLSLSSIVKQAGGMASTIMPKGGRLANLTWAGFREVNWIDGEWPGEKIGFRDLVDETLACDPDILVTHSPPGGILDFDMITRSRIGIAELTTALAYRPHNVRYHFFGHCHGDGGKVVQEMGITFVNGAGHARLHDIAL